MDRQLVTISKSGTQWLSLFLLNTKIPEYSNNLIFKTILGSLDFRTMPEDTEPFDINNSIAVIRDPFKIVESYMNNKLLFSKESRLQILNNAFYNKFKIGVDSASWEDRRFLFEATVWLCKYSLGALKLNSNKIFQLEKITDDIAYAKDFCKSLDQAFYEDKWYKLRRKHINRTNPYLNKTFDWADDYAYYIKILEKYLSSYTDEFYGYKHPTDKPRKFALNVGCGEEYREQDDEYTWINVDRNSELDIDLNEDFSFLSKRFEGKFFFIEAKDVLEHIPVDWDNKYDWIRVLLDWCKCLAIDGVIRIQTTDLYSLMHLLQIGEIDEVEYNRRLFDERYGADDVHYQAFSIGRLRRVINDLGLMRVERYSQINGNLIMEARRIK